jgi:2'-5' RNA ligase
MGTQLSALIRELAQRFDAPVFEPHVTLYVSDAANENPHSVLAKVASGRGPYRLDIAQLSYSDKFTKTLFVQFAAHPDLTRFSEDLRRASASRNDYELNPHLSLIYKEMDAETKSRLASSIALPFKDVIFESVKAVISPATINSWADVEAWRVVAKRKVAG